MGKLPCDLIGACVLARCALVNRLWWAEAVPHIYAEYPYDCLGDWSGHGLLSGLRDLADPDRRQFFASCVKLASLATVKPTMAKKCDRYMRRAVFPKLHTLTLVLHKSSQHVPRMRAPAVRRLEIDPLCTLLPASYPLDGDGMENVFDQIVTLFPNLEEVVFLDRAFVRPESLERFSARLPRLKSFDHSLVSTEGYPRPQ
ncbi:hypothetical protein AURDEDRAFT_162969 [Auricularia subglabra TFB-10046 SS5]|nr:hypothetical protein AURDEDRAFT_162969 [Auricularia subglabra TFB-10046 SS5]